MKYKNTLESKLERRKFRLAIAIPSLLLLFTIATGVINNQIIQIYEETFIKAGIQKSVLEDISDYLTITTGCLGALSVIFGIGLAYSIIHPIRRLTQSVRDVASGNLSKQVAIPNLDEIGELSNNFNSMLNSLQNLFKERNKLLFESFSNGIITIDLSGNVLTVNSMAENILNIESSEIVGKNLTDFLSSHNDYLNLKNIISEAIKRKTPIEDIDVTFYDVEKNEKEVSLAIIPFKNENQNIVGLLMIFHDISRINSLQNRLKHADQLATIGTFAMGVAHEIRNPLCSIRSMTQILQDKLTTETKEKQYTSLIISECDRLNHLISQLLDFSHPDITPPENCDINELLAKTVMLSKSYTISKTDGVIIKENYSKDVPNLTLQKEKIIQAILNILNNSWDAIESNGAIEISTEMIQEDSEKILIKISNTGPKIPEEVQAKIFDPFFSTKAKGSGLGLPISYQIITSNGGTIDFTSTDEKTSFYIKFPIKIKP